MVQNGFLIQDIGSVCYVPSHFRYEGMNAFDNHPLLGLSGERCEHLSDRQMFKKEIRGAVRQLEFISEKSLFNEYLSECLKQGLKTRILSVESEYKEEIYPKAMSSPRFKVIGYEYSPIPLDIQIVSDLDWFNPLFRYHKWLNRYGLFASYKDASRFMRDYNHYLEQGLVGDGLQEAYIFRVATIA